MGFSVGQWITNNTGYHCEKSGRAAVAKNFYTVVTLKIHKTQCMRRSGTPIEVVCSGSPLSSKQRTKEAREIRQRFWVSEPATLHHHPPLHTVTIIIIICEAQGSFSLRRNNRRRREKKTGPRSCKYTRKRKKKQKTRGESWRVRR